MLFCEFFSQCNTISFVKLHVSFFLYSYLLLSFHISLMFSICFIISHWPNCIEVVTLLFTTWHLHSRSSHSVIPYRISSQTLKTDKCQKHNSIEMIRQCLPNQKHASHKFRLPSLWTQFGERRAIRYPTNRNHDLVKGEGRLEQTVIISAEFLIHYVEKKR